MNSALVLWFVHNKDTDAEDPLVIGVYRTKENAESAIGRLAQKPGFVDEPAGFEISEYELNKDHWIEGFIRREGFILPAWFRPDST